MNISTVLPLLLSATLIITLACLYAYSRHRASERLKAAYHELEVANARVEESSRMKSDFIQQISHEIRTPLNILSGFTQLLTTPGIFLDDATLADINRQITANTNRITSLVNKMLELSEAKSLAVIDRTDNVSAEQIVAEAVTASRITNANHLTFNILESTESKTAVLQTNKQAAVRALSLLLDNARKFTKKGEVRLIIQQQPGTFDFIVEDTGIGVPAQEAEHIFDEFVQLDEYYDGTGIGLTVARSIARRLGGDIVLDTSYSGGARFVMSLPKE